MLNAPHVEGPDGMPQQIEQSQIPPPGTQFHDLRKGKYAISVNIGKSYQTRLQEGQSEIGEVLSSAPNLMPLLGATYFRFRDFPGSKEIADILKKVRDKQFPGLDSDKPGPSMDQLQAENQSIKGQLQQMQQQLQMAMHEIQTDKAKQEATMAKAQMDNQTKEVIARMEQQTKLILAQMEKRHESVENAKQQVHDRDTQLIDQTHEATMQTMPQPMAPPDLTYKGSAEIPLPQEESV